MMNSIKKAESLAWIIIGVFILSFVLLGIWALVWSSRDIIDNFDKKIDLDLLIYSSNSVVGSMDLSNLSDGDEFYLHRDTVNWNFDIYTWSNNSNYQYIDRHWYKVDDINSFEGDIYSRIFNATKVEHNGEEKMSIKTVIDRISK